MLRISVVETDGALRTTHATAETTAESVTLRLEGRIVGPWVEELREVGERMLNESRALTLDLAEVSYIDRSGIMLVAAFARRSVTIANCSAFLEEQLKAIA